MRQDLLVVLLVLPRPLREVLVQRRLQERDAHPEQAEPEKETGRSQQHPTLAHLLVGQLFPPWNGGSRRPPAPLARCCDAAGRHPGRRKRRSGQFTWRLRAFASGTSDWSARPAAASSAGEP